MKKMIKTPQFWKKDQKLSQEKLPQSNRHNPQKGKEMCKKISTIDNIYGRISFLYNLILPDLI